MFPGYVVFDTLKVKLVYDWLFPGAFIVKTLIYFEFLCPYSLIPIRHTYIFKNIVEAVEPSAKDPGLRND